MRSGQNVCSNIIELVDMSLEDWKVSDVEDKEAYEGLLLFVLLASVKKVKAGLRQVDQHQELPAGYIELGVALDAISMLANDIIHFVEINK